MVFFTCNGCGSSLKKAAVEKHYQFECRNCEVLSCMDCGKDFYGDDYKLHTTCVTEDEKYGGKDYKATPNKGDVKQAQWMERVKKASENPAVDHKVKQILSRLHGGLMNNVPRKKPKFKNFLANSFRIHDDRLAEKVWDILNTSVDDEKTTNGQTANKPHKDTKTSNASAKLADQSQASKQKHQGDPEFMTEGDEEVSAAVVKKKKKKKKKSNEENTEHILAKSGDQVESHISESNSKQVLMDKEEFIVNGHNENNSSDSKTRRKKKKNLHKEVTKMNGKTGDDNFGVDWAEQKVKKRKRSQENDFDDKTEAKAAKVFKQEQEQQLPPTGGKFPWEQVITQVLRKGSDKEISVKKLRKKETMSTPSLLSRFQGCLVEAVVGDCLGANFEVYGVPRRNTIQKIFDFVRKALPGADSDDNTRKFHYTDDTAMARSVADCLIANNGKIDAEDLAKRFGIEFKAAPNRGYGPNVMTVLRAFSADDLSDVFEPARQQFGGDGSYGNGGAMRVAPVALPHQPNKIDEVIQVARTSALLTHANKLGYNGAILQACAVHFALHTDHDTFDCEEYISKLLGIMERIENVGGGDGLIEGVEEDSSSASKRVKKNETNEPSEGNSDRLKTKDEAVYCERLNTMKKFLKEEPSLKQVAEELGNKISAHFSVGSAVYSFLRGLSPIDEIPGTNPVERTIVFAISLGGDTDTIASMAGAIAGAYHGIESIPTEWIKVCEGTDFALQQAKDLFDIYESMSGSK